MPAEFCPRQIVFEIPGSPGVLVTATEDGSGGIDFIVDVQDGATITGDLRGLFFDFVDESKLAGLDITDGSGVITETRVEPNSVIDLGNGANMKGATKQSFDIGIEFGTQGIGHGDDIHDPVSFTVTNDAGDLTLDDIAHQRFGARVTSTGSPDGSRSGSEKLIVIAPAAPDANDDGYTIFEDNSTGLDDPSKTPTDYVMNVLANDTDGDGDPLTIISIHEQPDHGTVSITDGGTTITYTPELDYAGQVTFEYCVSDGNGGQDHATVTIDLTPVADVPLFDVVVEGTDNVNEVLITVTVDQDDADGSEFMDSLTTSLLPAGVTIAPVSVDPPGQPASISQAFLLTMALDHDYDFDLTFTGTAEEMVGGDQQTGTYVVPILYEYNSTTVAAEFNAVDQSIWSTGNEFTFNDNRFFGVDTGPFGGQIGPSWLYAGIDGDFMAGFQSNLHFEGGDIDATADYDITVETNYNKTVDTLLIDTGTLFQGAIFDTVGPQGSYTLDFLWDLYLAAYVGVDISVDLFVTEIGWTDRFDFTALDTDGSVNLIDLNSDDLEFGFTFPSPFDSVSLDFAWPNITTNGTVPTGMSTGESNDFFTLTLDMDQLLSQLLFGGVNPFDIDFDLFGGIFNFGLELLDFDLLGSLNFVQNFDLNLGDLVGTFAFENGSSQSFTIGDSIQVSNALDIDAGGDNDGIVEFTFTVAPAADLTNETLLQFNVGYNLDLFTVEFSYDIEVDSDTFTFGPLVDLGDSVPVTDVPVYDETFALNIVADSFSFGA
ncbi:MAG: cadherin-like domain-containing protein [Novosphingobium sp.]|nr:cadherin-like domain-containing protein [Novosphingobium sp.]